jgi:hypothetical protein
MQYEHGRDGTLWRGYLYVVNRVVLAALRRLRQSRSRGVEEETPCRQVGKDGRRKTGDGREPASTPATPPPANS